MYMKELREKRKQLKEDIKELEKATAMPQPITPEFMNKYRQLNEKRIDLITVKSRIENYGKPRPGIEEYNITIQ